MRDHRGGVARGGGVEGIIIIMGMRERRRSRTTIGKVGGGVGRWSIIRRRRGVWGGEGSIEV